VKIVVVFKDHSISQLILDKILFVLGMTTHGIHQYKLGILQKLGLKEENIVKFQTGGPDGDLGSNEIKISKDKTKVALLLTHSLTHLPSLTLTYLHLFSLSPFSYTQRICYQKEKHINKTNIYCWCIYRP
jgi:hypothetical protein